MKLLRQFILILAISLFGELLKYLIPLPIPASIYGMVILFLCLLTGALKLEAVKDAGKFLIEIMPVMFIPAGTGLIASWDVLQPILLPVLLVTFVTLAAVIAVTGRVSQWIIRKEKGAEK